MSTNESRLQVVSDTRENVTLRLDEWSNMKAKSIPNKKATVG